MELSTWVNDFIHSAWQILNVNLNYFVTQCGRSFDPNLGRDPLFADPDLCHTPVGLAMLCTTIRSACHRQQSVWTGACLAEMSRLWNFSVRVQSWSDKIESDPVLIRKIFENHESDPVLIRQCKIMYFYFTSWGKIAPAVLLPHEAK